MRTFLRNTVLLRTWKNTTGLYLQLLRLISGWIKIGYNYHRNHTCVNNFQIEPEFWERNYGSPTNKKEVRDEMKKYLYSFKAKKNQIDYLCKTAISEGIFNKEDSENVGQLKFISISYRFRSERFIGIFTRGMISSVRKASFLIRCTVGIWMKTWTQRAYWSWRLFLTNISTKTRSRSCFWHITIPMDCEIIGSKIKNLLQVQSQQIYFLNASSKKKIFYPNNRSKSTAGV